MRRGMTLIEMLVVIAVIGILLGLVLGAVQDARQAAYRVQCRNNLHQIAIAMNHYEEAHGCFPPGAISATASANPVPGYNTRPDTAWGVLILPYLEESPLYRQYDFNFPAWAEPNLSLSQSYLKQYECPLQGTGTTLNPVSDTVQEVRRGLTVTETSGNAPVLPFAISQEEWFNAPYEDNYTYDAESGTFVEGADGIPEKVFFPLDTTDDTGESETESSGNFGTVDIGDPDNSADELIEQIYNGVTAEDLAWHGGALEFDENGILTLTGDTGMTTSIKTALNDVLGQARIMFVYESVANPGNNAEFRITDMVGGAVVDVQMTGKRVKRKVVVQDAYVDFDKWAIKVVQSGPGAMALSSYAPCYGTSRNQAVGQDGLFDLNSCIMKLNIGDGTGQTIMVGEVLSCGLDGISGDPTGHSAAGIINLWAGSAAEGTASIQHVASGTDGAMNFIDTPENGTAYTFGSRHRGGAFFAMADGSVRFLSENIDFRVYQALSTIRGREVIDDKDY